VIEYVWVRELADNNAMDVSHTGVGTPMYMCCGRAAPSANRRRAREQGYVRMVGQGLLCLARCPCAHFWRNVFRSPGTRFVDPRLNPRACRDRRTPGC
jgi:hypothetical protein